MQNRIEELHRILLEYEEEIEILNDIEKVKEMILKTKYEEEKVKEIESRYALETDILMKIEEYKEDKTNHCDDEKLQILLNLRDRLYFIAVYKLLKYQKREIPKNFAQLGYPDLIYLVENNIK